MITPSRSIEVIGTSRRGQGELGDGDGDQAVMVDEITAAVSNALDGCVRATRYADLVPLSARENCNRGCGPYSSCDIICTPTPEPTG